MTRKSRQEVVHDYARVQVITPQEAAENKRKKDGYNKRETRKMFRKSRPQA